MNKLNGLSMSGCNLLIRALQLTVPTDSEEAEQSHYLLSQLTSIKKYLENEFADK